MHGSTMDKRAMSRPKPVLFSIASQLRSFVYETRVPNLRRDLWNHLLGRSREPHSASSRSTVCALYKSSVNCFDFPRSSVHLPFLFFSHLHQGQLPMKRIFQRLPSLETSVTVRCYVLMLSCLIQKEIFLDLFTFYAAAKRPLSPLQTILAL